MKMDHANVDHFRLKTQKFVKWKVLAVLVYFYCFYLENRYVFVDTKMCKKSHYYEIASHWYLTQYYSG